MEVDPLTFVHSLPISKESILLTFKTTMNANDKSPEKEKEKDVMNSPSDSMLTVRAALAGNVMLLFEVESTPVVGYPARAIVLERCIAQLEDSTPILPYPFVLIQYDQKFWFSCFGEDDRAEWVRAIIGCSHEMLANGVLRYQEQIVECETCNKFCRLANSHQPGFEPQWSVDENVRSMGAERYRLFEALYCRTVCRPFNVADVELFEHMAEPKTTLTVPKQLLDCASKFFTFLLDQTARLNYLPKELDTRRMFHLNCIGDMIAKLKESLDYMHVFQGFPFKSSLCKDIETLAFLPTNLHVQCVSSDQADQAANYFTCGAFTAYSEGYDRGGLRTMVSELSESAVPSGLFDPDLKRVARKLRFFASAELELHEFRCKVEKSFQTHDLKVVVAECKELVVQAKKFYSSVTGQLPARSSDRFNALTEQLTAWFEKANVKDSAASIQSMRAHGDDFEAELASLHTKVENMSHCHDYRITDEGEALVGLHQSAQALLGRLESLQQTMIHGYLLEMLNCLVTRDTVKMFHNMFYRYNIVLSQALASVTAVLLHGLWLSTDEQFRQKMSLWSRCGALVSIHSFLSCNQAERFMLEDMIEITCLLRARCKFRLLQASSTTNCTPVVEGDIGGIKVSLAVPKERWESVPENLKQGEWFQLHAVLWNVGVNNKQSLAVKFRECTLENQVNEKAGMLMERYYWSARRCEQLNDHQEVIKESLARLRTLNKADVWKNVPLAHHAMHLTRQLSGDLILCCKSGKDRTSMAVTHDEILFVQKWCNMSDSGVVALRQLLRTQGTRMENVYKNMGARKYAFKSGYIQLLPDEYRPPEGHYASLQT